MSADETFELVDEAGCVIGLAPRRRCHGDPSLIHQAVHVLVFHPAGRLFLQKRSAAKDVQPGKWDTSVGGHMQPGETPEETARREMSEELGKKPGRIEFAYQYVWRSPIETELVRAFATSDEGPFRLDPVEVDDGRFWEWAEIEARLPENLFTTQFAQEYPRMKAWWSTHDRGT